MESQVKNQGCDNARFTTHAKGLLAQGSTPPATACQITSSLKEISTAAASSRWRGCFRCRLLAIPHFQHRAHLSSQFLDLVARLRFPLARLDL